MCFFLPSFSHFENQVCIALGYLYSVLYYVHCMHVSYTLVPAVSTLLAALLHAPFSTCDEYEITAV